MPLVRTVALDRWGHRARGALDRSSELLTTQQLVALDRAVEIDGQIPAGAAAACWAAM